MSAEERSECIFLINEAVESGARKFKACEILSLNIRTIERWENNLEDRRRGPLKTPSNALSEEERSEVLRLANSAEFANLSPSQIVPKLADQGKYVACESSFYRILRQEKLLAHRGKSNPPMKTKPEELKATKPNEIWSWDITYLKSTIKGMYFYLYLPMDIFSRKIVYWEVHESENSFLSATMINNAAKENNLTSGQVILHSDNGGPMRGATMLATLHRLGITPSFSRPRVSNDNPYSESLFKTLKYCPSFPENGFVNIEEAKEWVRKFVYWYNYKHLHSGINFVTPDSKHSGEDQKILNKRHTLYQEAKLKNPSRWSGKTRNWNIVDVVELNPGKKSKEQKDLISA